MTEILAERRSRKRWRTFKKYLPLYLMLLPGIAYLIINNYIPMSGILVAFRKYNVRTGLYGGRWVGWDNFIYLFKNDASLIIRNTLLYNIAFIIVNMFFGIVFAVMICDVQSKFMKKAYQSSVLLPFLVSIVIVSYIVYAFLSPADGLLNKTILPALGKEEIGWYSEPKYWPFILIFVNCWKNVGYGCLIYIAAIVGIDKSLFESARLDGATKWEQIRFITLPHLVPAIITLSLLQIGRIFYSDFGLFYQVPQNSGALFSATNTIDTYVYRALISAGGIGRSSAAGLFQSVVGFSLVVFSNMIVRKVSNDNALF